MKKEDAVPFSPAAGPRTRGQVVDHYHHTRHVSERLSSPLSAEDQQVQSMEDASPTKWHLAHTTWFFETLILQPHLPTYREFHPGFAYLFNSYYESLGQRHPRPARGMVTRPSVSEVWDYRRHVDRAMHDLMTTCTDARWDALKANIVLGINHEEQHQELLLTDIKHLLSLNPLSPAFATREGQSLPPTGRQEPLRWLEFAGGVHDIGASDEGFAFDCERPRHKAYLQDFQLASRPVTNREYMNFIEDGGYATASLWLSDGWATVQEHGWHAPIYWREGEDGPREFTLAGELELDPGNPVTHLSYFEASAYAEWAGTRLPTEQEWEVAAGSVELAGNFLDSGHLQPRPAETADEGLAQMFGDVWEWTLSPYTPYPGFEPLEGPVGEYNGKFMSSQMVLRGGSCATPARHIRPTYRNFFPPAARWQFTGLRMARNP